MNLLIVTASHRPDSLNGKLARLVDEQAQARGYATYRPDYEEFDCVPYSDLVFEQSGVPAGAMHFTDGLAKADGVVFAVPEYNWSFPGSLKNLIDWTSRVVPSPFPGKVVLLLCATLSQRGGASCIQQFRFPLEMLDMIVAPRSFMLGSAHEAFRSDGRLKDAKRMQQFDATVSQYFALLEAVHKPA